MITRIKKSGADLFLGICLLIPVAAYYMGNAFWLDIGTRLVILSIAAVSLNFILGYGGLISFGHAAFLGIGAYSVGIPAYYGVYSGVVHFGVAIIAGALFAFVTGLIALKTKGVHFIMITMAFAQMVFYLFVSLDEYGGDDGLVIDARSEFPLLNLEDNLVLYSVCSAILLLSIYLFARLVDSKFGYALRACASNEERVNTLGYHPYRYRLVAYVISGVVASIAGALLGNFTYYISPEMIDWSRSGELMFIVILGGAATRFGPVLGAVIFVVLEEILSSYTIYWKLPFGLLLLFIVLVGRGGIDGLLKKIMPAR